MVSIGQWLQLVLNLAWGFAALVPPSFQYGQEEANLPILEINGGREDPS